MRVVFENTTGVGADKLKKIVINDAQRPVMQGVYIDFKHKYLVCTDAYVLAMYPIEIKEKDTELDGVIVPVRFFDRLKWMIELKAKWMRDALVEFVLTDGFAEVFCNGELAYRCRYIEGKYPNYQAVLCKEENKTRIDTIGIDPKIVSRLFDAVTFVGENHYSLTFFGGNRAIMMEMQGNKYPRPIRAMFMPKIG
jgi:DNA polymerase III beta subunit, central domain